MRSSIAVLAACATLALSACHRHPAAQPATADAARSTVPASNATAERLNAVMDQYWEDYLALHPLTATALGDHRYDGRFGDYASPAWMADGLAIEQNALEKLAGIDARKLSADERSGYEAFRLDREIAAEGYRYPSELLPFDPAVNLPARFALLGSGQDAQPFRTARDYDNFLGRMDGFVAWVDQVINNLRSGLAKDVVYPRTAVERVLPPLEALGVVDPRQSVFWQPILNFPAGLTVTDRRRLIDAYQQRLGKSVLPAYRRLHDFLKNEYLPRARTRPGMDALPSGDLWYAYLVRYYTGTRLTPAEVHEIGLREVARSRADAERVMHQVGHVGDLRSFFEAMRADSAAYAATPAELLAGYSSIRERVGSGLPLLFATVPRTPLAIRAAEPVRAYVTGGASYRAPAIDAGPGVLYVNTTDLASRPRYLMEVSFLHEALPGHHLQRALAQENAALPRVRRYDEGMAFREGWALYAQTLGRDLGLYTDPYSLAGEAMTELWMGARVVVDTGLHARGWTREQAIEYLRANSGLTDVQIAADVDLSLAAPGQTLAYKMGQVRFLELRSRAQQKLGARFDARQFHARLLANGGLPFPVLEQQVDRWLAQGR